MNTSAIYVNRNIKLSRPKNIIHYNVLIKIYEKIHEFIKLYFLDFILVSIMTPTIQRDR